MMVIKVKDKEYKVKFGFNCFIDTDLLERTEKLIKIFDDSEHKDDKYGMERIKDLFTVTRELLFVGFKKYNPLETLEDVGNLLDDYADEGTEENPHDLLELFGTLSNELMNEGFLKGVMNATASVPQQRAAKKPQDHLKAQK